MSVKFRAALWWLLCVVVGLPCAVAQAQSQARPDPGDPAAGVSAAPYQSTLRGYQAFADPAPAPWRELNERVGQRGGWRAYAREPRDGDVPLVPPAAASAPVRAAP